MFRLARARSHELRVPQTPFVTSSELDTSRKESDMNDNSNGTETPTDNPDVHSDTFREKLEEHIALEEIDILDIPGVYEIVAKHLYEPVSKALAETSDQEK